LEVGSYFLSRLAFTDFLFRHVLPCPMLKWGCANFFLPDLPDLSLPCS
jgi:hypothetical protein